MLAKILIFSVFLFSQSPAKKAEGIVLSYFKQLHKEIDADLVAQSFVSTYTLDTRLFAKCRHYTCRFKTQVVGQSRETKSYQVKIKVEYEDRRKWKPISHRKGCYLVQDFKMKAYQDGCPKLEN